MPEFDRYARQYSDLLHDPVREWFAPGSSFFVRRKWEVLWEYMAKTHARQGTAAWLDVGCGKGELLRLGASHFARAAGCDVSAAMTEACRDLEVVPQREPARLPFGDAEFDLVTAICVYHHLQPGSPPLLTAEIARVLRPAGTVCIMEHNPLNPVTRLIVRRSPVDEEARMLSAGTAKRLLAGAGLEIVQRTFFLYFPESLHRAMRGLEAGLGWLPAGGQYAVFARKK
jgi:SAM-dependent methyltransferase